MMTSEAKPPKVRDWTWLKVVASILLGVASFGIIITILAIVAFPDLFVLEVARVALLGVCILVIVALGVSTLATMIADVHRVTLPKEKRAITTRWVGSNWWWAVWLFAWSAVTYMVFFLETDPAWELIQASFLLLGVATVISAVDSMERFLHRDFTPWVLAIVLTGLIFVTFVGLLVLIEADFVQAVVLLLLVLLVIRVTTLPVTIARRYGKDDEKDDEIVFAETPNDSSVVLTLSEFEALKKAYKTLWEMYDGVGRENIELRRERNDLQYKYKNLGDLYRELLSRATRENSQTVVPETQEEFERQAVGTTIAGRRDARVEETPAPNVQVVAPPEVRVNTADEGDVEIDVDALEQALNEEGEE